MKGVSPLLSYFLYVGIGLSVIAIISTAGVDTLDTMQDTAAIDQMQSSLLSIDRAIEEVIRGGRGVQRPAEIQVDRGSIAFRNQSLIYEIQTPADIITAGTRQESGRLGLSSNTDVQLFEASHNGTPCYRLRNEYIETCIRKQATFQEAGVRDMFLYLDGNDIERSDDPAINISINDDLGYTSGLIRTRPEETGMTMQDAAVLIDVKPADRPGYTIRYALRSGADFYQLQIE